MEHRDNPRNVALWSVVGLLVFLTAGCAVPRTAPTSNNAITGSPTESLPSPTALSSPRATAPSQVPFKARPVSTDPAAGISVNAAGAVLPNSAGTPGATNPLVSQANIGKTICVSGWTATVRPNSSVTTELKVAQLASGYTYRGDTATGDYEEDHLISLEIGGAPSAEANLWPEPFNAPEGARV